MKILLIDVNYGNSSTGKIVQDLHRELEKKGHLVRVCFGRGAKVKNKNVLRVSPTVEVYFHALMTRLTGLTGYFSPLATAKLLEEIKNFSPDVVHIHELHGYFINIRPVLDLLKEMNIKVVWTFHCEFMYTGKCGHAYECDGWKKECGKCPHLRDYPSSLLFDFTKKMFNDKKRMFNDFDNITIVTVSKWLAERVKQSFLRDKSIKVIHNGIDTTNIFYVRSFDHLKEKHNITNEKVILAVAPDLMSERKGGRHVLRLAKRMKNERIKFILIGVKEINEKYDDNVLALPRTENQHELAAYYSMADVFVICSQKETFGLTCVESLSCGTPVCGFNAGGNMEIVPDSMGKLVEYGDMDALENSVRHFLKKENISRECSEYGQVAFSKEKMFENYFKLYQQNFLDWRVVGGASSLGKNKDKKIVGALKNS